MHCRATTVPNESNYIFLFVRFQWTIAYWTNLFRISSVRHFERQSSRNLVNSLGIQGETAYVDGTESLSQSHLEAWRIEFVWALVEIQKYHKYDRLYRFRNISAAEQYEKWSFDLKLRMQTWWSWHFYEMDQLPGCKGFLGPSVFQISSCCLPSPGWKMEWMEELSRKFASTFKSIPFSLSNVKRSSAVTSNVILLQKCF